MKPPPGLSPIVLWVLWCHFGYIAAKRNIPIGGIFPEGGSDPEIAFRYAVDRLNMYNHDAEIVPLVYRIPARDNYKALKTVCNMTMDGVAAVLGPQSEEMSNAVASACTSVEVPHIQSHWQMESSHNKMSINMYPESIALANALAELIQDYEWKAFTLIYEHKEGLMRLQEVLKIHGPEDPPITVRQLSSDGDNRPLLKEIHASGETRIILDCDADKIIDILRQAKEVNLMEDYQSYILTSLDTHTVDFAELKFGLSNITAMRLVNPKSFEIRNAVHDWEQGEMRIGKKLEMTPDSVRVDTALMYDSVNLFATALHDLNEGNIETEALECGTGTSWKHGLRLIEYMKIKPIQGLTGPIQFDAMGRRTHFSLEVIELSKDGFINIATWDPINGINYTRSFGEAFSKIVETLQNKTFIVSSRLGKPFLMEKPVKEGEVLEGNARYEGYSMDLIDGISKILGFQYKFELVPDGRYGSFNKDTKKWDGLVKQLLDRKADLAVCDLTITYERRTAVDFTMPFMTLGISILFSKPVKEPPELFAFLSPLSWQVWSCMGAAYIGVSLMLFMLSRMAPEDWENPHPCNEEPEELENIWNLLNCVWLTMGSIMGQGCDILPKAASTRMVTGMWWFFALIMLASYTANLAAFLTMERMDVTINNADDLAKQTKIKYGVLLDGSTMAFFKNNNFTLYQRIWAGMESTKPSVFTDSNDEGVERVLKGKRLFAFFMESTTLQYAVERNCDLMQINGQLDSKGYGIAMPVTVLKMQEEGKLLVLKEKWWKQMYGGKQCKADDATAGDSAAELGIDNVGGVFVVLGGGCGVAFFIALLEFLWHVNQVALEEKIGLLQALGTELKFAMNVWITTKPVHNKPSESSESTKSKVTASRAGSESRSVAGNVLKTATSLMRLDRAKDLFN